MKSMCVCVCVKERVRDGDVFDDLHPLLTESSDRSSWFVPPPAPHTHIHTHTHTHTHTRFPFVCSVFGESVSHVCSEDDDFHPILHGSYK